MRQTQLWLPEPFRPLVEKRARYKAYFSGRGCAKSTSFAIACILMAAQEPCRILCCREVQKTIKESVKYDLDKVIMQNGLQRKFVSTMNTITCMETGAYIMFEGLQSVRAFKLQSLSDIDIVWVEEAQAITKASLSILIPTIRKDGSQIWFSWNPHSPKDPVDAMFRDEKNPITEQAVPDELKEFYDVWAIVKNIKRDDPTTSFFSMYFPQVLRVEMERDRQRDPDLYRHVWEGEYSHRSDAAVFKNWRIGELEIGSDERPYFGADWGFSVDPTVLVKCFILEKTRQLYIEREVGGVGIEIDKTPALFDSIADLPDEPFKDQQHPRNWPMMADSARPETISYMAQHGYNRIERARKGPGSVEEGIEFIRKYDVVINPNCKRCIDEFTYYSYERDKKTEEITPKLVDDHNHVIDAVRYAVEIVRRNPYTVVGAEVITQPIAYPGDPRPESNPALGIGGSKIRRPDGLAPTDKGLCW